MSDRVPGRNLSPNEKARAIRVAVAALARGETLQRAAELAEINIRTLSEYRREPEFQQLLDRETERLAEQEPEAILLLRRALSDPNISANQIRAAQVLLQQVPDEAAASMPAEVVFNLDAEAVERVLASRREQHEEETASFNAQQNAQAARVERLYAKDTERRPPLRAVPEPKA